MSPIEQRHADLLEFETPNEIADFLRSKGIKGIPAFGDVCPIAKYLQQGLEEENLMVEVDLEAIYWHRKDEVEMSKYGYAVYINYTLDVTDAMADFITIFDAGDDYSDLNQRNYCAQ